VTWPADLAELATRARIDDAGEESWWSSDGLRSEFAVEDADFIAACSPERIRALCELAETALAHQYGDATVYDLRERLDAIEALEKEEAC